MLFLNWARPKNQFALAKDIIMVTAKERNNDLKDLLGGSDDFGNNLMHLTEGKFADGYWVKLIPGENKETLQEIVKVILKQKNNKDQTPI